jgi:hypothetical protein
MFLKEIGRCAIKTHLAYDPNDNSWNVTVKDARGNGKMFEVKEKELLGKEFIIEHAYNDLYAEQKKKVLAKNKQMQRKETRAEETKLANIARERRRELEQEEYNNIVDIFESGCTYKWQEFRDLLDRMREPFSCSVDGRDVTVTKADAAITMKKSALDEISQILVSNKRAANDGTNKPAAKQRQNNAACSTTHGATGFDALHGVARHDHHGNKANQAKLVKGHQREKEAITKLLPMVEKRKVEYAKACVAAMEAAHVARRRRATVLHRVTTVEEGVLREEDVLQDGAGRIAGDVTNGNGGNPGVVTDVGGQRDDGVKHNAGLVTDEEDRACDRCERAEGYCDQWKEHGGGYCD